MKRFMDEDFLLHSEFAEDLYHEYAENLPILDYHTHIPVRDIAENRVYHNLTEVLVDNPVARRLMRANGVAERFITGGEAPARERFQYFAEALAKAAGNPVYTWVHLVLKRVFDCHYVLSGETADDVWSVCSEKFADGTMTVRSLLEQGNVAAVFTADRPEDNLKWHRQLKEQGYPVQVLPVFHPDAALDIANPEWGNYMLYDLGQTADVEISTMNEVREALAKRIAYFASMGCRTADHAFPRIVYREAEEYELDDIVGRVINSKGAPTQEEIEKYQTAVLRFLGKKYAERGWVMQLHYGILRDMNSKMAAGLGSGAGSDCISASSDGEGLAALLDLLSREEALPRMIVSSMNPSDQVVIGSILGAFQTEDAGHLQLGPSWWINQTPLGIRAQIGYMASLGIIGTAVGFSTDARSALFWPRHEYYRRIFCDALASLVDEGLYPPDKDALGRLIKDVCYENVKSYFHI